MRSQGEKEPYKSALLPKNKCDTEPQTYCLLLIICYSILPKSSVIHWESNKMQFLVIQSVNIWFQGHNTV